jgi:hypothetical protein
MIADHNLVKKSFGPMIADIEFSGENFLHLKLV